MTEYMNYIITAIGLTGFALANKKVWWCWYINIFNQILWFVYGFSTQQWGFVLGTIPYTIVFSWNAYTWTKEHRSGTRREEEVWTHDESRNIGKVESVSWGPDGITAVMKIADGVDMAIFNDGKPIKLDAAGEEFLEHFTHDGVYGWHLKDPKVYPFARHFEPNKVQVEQTINMSKEAGEAIDEVTKAVLDEVRKGKEK